MSDQLNRRSFKIAVIEFPYNLEVTMKTRRTEIFVVCFAALLIRTAAVQAENWPGFRGPTGQGISTEKGLPLHWSGKENIA